MYGIVQMYHTKQRNVQIDLSRLINYNIYKHKHLLYQKECTKHKTEAGDLEMERLQPPLKRISIKKIT
jgi:hypothetical protein